MYQIHKDLCWCVNIIGIKDELLNNLVGCSNEKSDLEPLL